MSWNAGRACRRHPLLAQLIATPESCSVLVPLWRRAEKIKTDIRYWQSILRETERGLEAATTSMPRWNFPADREFPAYASEPLRLAPRGRLRSGMLVIAVVAGMGLLALVDPGSIDMLVATEL